MNKNTAFSNITAKRSFLEFGYCELGFVWDLVLGICDLIRICEINAAVLNNVEGLPSQRFSCLILQNIAAST